MNKISKYLFLINLIIAWSEPTIAQQTITKAAGPEYKRSPLYQSLWGHNYRREWTTPVSFPVLMLDTAFGGLTPYKEGGGHQSKSLHLRTKEGKEYAMRSVDKTLTVLVPEIFHSTFAEHIVNDEISMSHPYAALTVPLMAEAAKIPHTSPRYVYVPEQPALDTFNHKYANTLYLIEQRPDSDWSDADNLGNFSKFISSETVRENLYENNSHEVDQAAFVKARLFDMFLGDWDRHEDQWKWSPVDKNNRTVYEPVPVDRDQPYAKFDGTLLKPAVAAAGAKYLQSFDYDIPYPQGFSYERKNLDRFFTNKISLKEWQDIASKLQQQLTDDVIERSVHELPSEIFAISGNDIIAKLKSRREHLGEYATKYYLFLAKTVDIVGSGKREFFKVSQVNENETQVSIYDFKDGQPRDEPYYSRTFWKNETDEIRLYGLSGKDSYTIDGTQSRAIKVRVIAGNDEDSITVSGIGKKVQIYDDKSRNNIQLHSPARLHLSSDSLIHSFDYDAFRPDKKGFKPVAGYNDEDRLFVGLAYSWQHQSFRKSPFAFKQSIGANYSISQTAFSALYSGVFTKLIGGWNLLLAGNYDAVRWTNFYGLGNQTPYLKKPVNYYRLRTQEWVGSVGLNRTFGVNNLTISGFYNSVKILRDPGKYITNNYLPLHPENLRTNTFLGASLKYGILHIDDAVIPQRGIIFKALSSYIHNLSDANKSFARFEGDVQFYVPIVPKISLAVSAGGATITGTPEFYQYPAIGGGANLRGYDRDRFRGKSAFYNSNELRFITNIKNYFLRGKGGLVAFFDDGRVWMPVQSSTTIHTSYGGGILIAPFNIMFFDVTYGVSKETTQIQLRGTMSL